MSKQEKALASVLAAIRKGYGDESALKLSEGSRSEIKEVIPSGVEVLNRYLLGCGGWPVGRLVEVFGPEGSGKTSLVSDALASAQRAGGVALLVETEFAFSEERSAVFGVDPEKLILSQPNNLEEVYDHVVTGLEAIPKDIGPNLLVWDSVASAPPKAEQEGEAADLAMGHRARLINKLCRVLPQLASEKRCAVIFVNQIRSKIGVVFGNPEETPGGPSIKYYASARLRLSAGKPVKDGPETTGRDLEIKVVKNKLVQPFREATVRLDFDAGFDDRWTTLSHAKDAEVIDQNVRASEEAYKKARVALGWDGEKKDDADAQALKA